MDPKNWRLPIGVELTRKEVYDAQEAQEKETRIAELERMVGKLTMQIELQKKVWSLANSLAQDNE